MYFLILGGISWNNIEDICLNSQMEKVYLTEIQKHGLKCRLEKFEIPQAIKLISEIWTPDMVHFLKFVLSKQVGNLTIFCFDFFFV